MRILFLIPYPLNEAPSQRFRFEQYTEFLENVSLIKHQSFLSTKTWRLFYSSGNTIPKLYALIIGFLKRMIILFTLPEFDFVFIHREAAPIGPPFFEWVIAKIFRKKIIFDFDDAIWMTDKTNESTLESSIRWRSKVAIICKWSYKISCGNEYLADYARRFNTNVVINPTTIDTEQLHNPELYKPMIHTALHKENIVIGWTGSHSTLKYLKVIEPVLQKLEYTYPHVSFAVIADKKPELALKRIEFIPWSKKSEAQDLLKIDIGIMPLPNDEWTKGKCGFKALQYMAMEIPCVASAVGVNKVIINSGQNGFLCETLEQWLYCLEMLISNAELRKRLGALGRKTVIENYSVSSNSSKFISLLV